MTTTTKTRRGKRARKGRIARLLDGRTDQRPGRGRNDRFSCRLGADHPADAGGQPPNLAEEQRKLTDFVSSIGMKLAGPAAWGLCPDGRVVWTFFAVLDQRAMERVIKTRNEHNRITQWQRSAQYANDMLYGRWRFTGEPLIFAGTGDLVDGQNRILGAIAAGLESLSATVVFGLPLESICYMGAPMLRSAAHRKQAEGRHYTDTRAKALALIHRWERSPDGAEKDLLEETGQGATVIGSRDKELETEYGERLDKALGFVFGLKWSIKEKLLPRHFGAFLFMLMADRCADPGNPTAAYLFMRALADNIHAHETRADGGVVETPMAVLEKRLRDLALKKKDGEHRAVVQREIGKGDSDAAVSRGHEAIVLRTVAAAWNAFCGGKSTGAFRAGHGATSTSAILRNLAQPVAKVDARASALFPAEALAAVTDRARTCRERAAAAAHAKLRDEGGVKVAAIRRYLDTL